MAAPEIAKTVRQMFETGKVMGLHEVRKTRAAELAAESGVFENEPASGVEGVVRSADYPTSDVDQVKQSKRSLDEGAGRSLYALQIT